MTIREVIIDISNEYKYFNIGDINNKLKENNVKFSYKSIKAYIYSLKKCNLFYSAGRGWYSSVKKKLHISNSSILPILRIIKKQFPEIKVSIWNTEQLKGFYHHIPFSFLTFLYIDKEYVSFVKEYLQQNDITVYENPDKTETSKFISYGKNIIILRNYVSYRNNNISPDNASIEKILVDLFIEKDKIDIMDDNEYKAIIKEILNNYRINISKMMDYAHNRKSKEKIKHILEQIKIIPMRQLEKKPQK